MKYENASIAANPRIVKTAKFIALNIFDNFFLFFFRLEPAFEKSRSRAVFENVFI